MTYPFFDSRNNAENSGPLLLMGLDIGSTTTSMMVASARILRNCVTARRELSAVQYVFRSEPIFTPFDGESINAPALAERVDAWLRDAGVDSQQVAAGGALVTGLAARASNANAVVGLIRDRFRNALAAVADDPGLESWLAWMGNALPLSLAEPGRAVINLDIGGGTTNVAWGVGDEVRRVGCYYVGARHIQVECGSYRIRALSTFGKFLLMELRLPAEPGEVLKPSDVAAVVDHYVRRLEMIVEGAGSPELADLHCQSSFVPPGTEFPDPIITLSGGVGELAYLHAIGRPLPATSAFGDIGIDLARRIAASPLLSHDLLQRTPTALGRATLLGLALHNSEASGATLYLPQPELLPLADLPIVGRCGLDTTAEALAVLVKLAASAPAGACIRACVSPPSAANLKSFGERIRRALNAANRPAGRPLVLLVEGNFGKTLGHYVTDWGRSNEPLIVIDEVTDRNAHFATLGAPFQNMIPVTYHGLQADLHGKGRSL